MGSFPRDTWLFLALVALVSLGTTTTSRAQFGLSNQFELSDSVHLDEADSNAKAHFQRVKAFLANQQWENAIETLCQVMENHGRRVVGVTERRYINVRDYCHLQLASLPPEGLALYRGRVDPQAQRWYEEAVADRDPSRLREIVEQMFCSSWGDESLYLLGEMALEAGDFGNARACWEAMLPATMASPDALANGPPTWLAYPDTNIEAADILARLILVSILEGSLDRATRELAVFTQVHPAAAGRIAGRESNFVDALSALLASARQWPLPQTSHDWTTLGGSPQRNKVLPELIDVGAIKWQTELPAAPSADFGYPPRRVAEDKSELLSYHPLVVGDLVLVNTSDEIRAYNLHTGEAAWGDDPVIYKWEDTQQRRNSRNILGAVRFTMTAYDNKLFARMGNPVTVSPNESLIPLSPGILVCLDLSAQGRLLWQVPPRDDGWAFEGSPLCDGANIYVAMRRGDVLPQAHVACLDAETGQLRWRQMICAAETPAQGQIDESTHNLLTLHGDTLYYSTNLGAVASLATHDGHVNWITLYPRAKSGNLNQRAIHFFRDLTPCIHAAGKLFVAPADSRRIMALDAPTGMLLWETSHPEDAIHMLGVGGGNLIVSGDKLWWIDVASGKLTRDPWPDTANPTPRGFGRGVLVEDKVLWPTRTTIQVFFQRSGEKVREIELSTRGAGGGNLLVAGGYLLIVTHDKLIALHRHTATTGGAEEVTLRGPRPARGVTIGPRVELVRRTAADSSVKPRAGE